jgi:predicted DNA-binding transcriptional regulator AlpA
MENLKVDQLFSEKNLAEALGVSRSTLYELRRKGCPWVSLGGRAFYYESSLMEWILKNQARVADLGQDDASAE